MWGVSCCACSWEIAPWASLTALGFTLSFDLQPMLASPFLASADTFLPVLGGLCGSGTLVCIDVLFQVGAVRGGQERKKNGCQIAVCCLPRCS